tara:strand:- start:83 stop:250 length:168 start_codon:yes stop_codon:yes gene_type:complete
VNIGLTHTPKKLFLHGFLPLFACILTLNVLYSNPAQQARLGLVTQKKMKIIEKKA